MKALNCTAARRRLNAFHDDELSIEDQIAIGAHLDWCDRCAAEFAELRLVRSALRAGVRRAAMSGEETASFQAAVVNRIRAEWTASVSAQLRGMFEDMHLVYAALGAAGATIVCVVAMLGMMHFATIERPDSLAALVNLLGSPGSNANPVPLDARILMPRALDAAFYATSDVSREDGAFALSGVVTREGRVANVELLNTSGAQARAEDTDQAIENLMDAVSRARFEPARVDGSPIAVNMVWIVAQTTVRADPQPLDPGVHRPGKKRVATLMPADRRRVNA